MSNPVLKTLWPALRRTCVVGAGALLVACASAPPAPSSAPGSPPPTLKPGPAPWSEKDGTGGATPSDVAQVANAEPRLELIRTGGPNKPYEVLGAQYQPMTEDRPWRERGVATWYGKKFHGRQTASGEVYNMFGMSAAHKTLPIPSYVRVRNPANGTEVIVRVNDRGPFVAGRIIDLSYAAAVKLDVHRGAAVVEIERITSEEIRTGAWRGRPSTGAPVAEPVVASASVPIVAATPPVRLEAAAQAEAVPQPPALTSKGQDADAASFWVQLGAFRQREGASGFLQRINAEADWLSPLVAIWSDKGLHRLQAGPFATRAQADEVAERVRQGLSLVPTITRR